MILVSRLLLKLVSLMPSSAKINSPQLGFEEVKRRNWTLSLLPRRKFACWKSAHWCHEVLFAFPAIGGGEKHCLACVCVMEEKSLFWLARKIKIAIWFVLIKSERIGYKLKSVWKTGLICWIFFCPLMEFQHWLRKITVDVMITLTSENCFTETWTIHLFIYFHISCVHQQLSTFTSWLLDLKE